MTYRLLVTMLLSVSVFLYTECFTNSEASDENATEQVARLSIKASFITSMLSDGDGGVFVGTEDYGVYHYDSVGNSKQFTTKDGLGDDNAYALAIDKLGRLWVGHLNTGVSVFNGKDWKNYDVIDGPIGERVFDIQTCPVDGDVWIATSAGITRYKLNADDWEHFTREDGLLEDQASSLAFKKDGTLIVGTQCHGIAVFNRSGGNLPKVYAAYYGDDWKTRGDWYGRAFRDWTIMCAVVSPFDYQIYFTNVFYDTNPSLRESLENQKNGPSKFLQDFYKK